MHYFGAGTSGPARGHRRRRAAAHLQRPRRAVRRPPRRRARGAASTAVENVEDDVELGARDAAAVGPCDVVVGLTASGRTPYVAGALAAARGRGALTLLVTANPQAELAADVDVLLAVDTGPEVITGSTRLKAGTAQKLVLNGFSTAVMVRLGRTWSNLMVDLVATNAKLRGRVIRILREASGADEADRAGRARAGRRRAEDGPAVAAGRDRARRRASRPDPHHGSVAQALRGAPRHPHGTAPHEQETSR